MQPRPAPPPPRSRHRCGPARGGSSSHLATRCPPVLGAGSECGVGTRARKRRCWELPAPRMPPHRLTPPAPSSGAASPPGPVHSHTQPRLVALPCRPARLPPRRPGPSEAAEGATQASPCPSLTAVHAEVALRADGLDEAVRPATKGRGERGGSRASGRGAPRLAALSVPSAKQGRKTGVGRPARPAHSHAGVHALAILLVLQPGLGQVDGEHAGDPDQPGNATIDELGWQTMWTEWVSGPVGHRAAVGWVGSATTHSAVTSHLICLSAI